MKISRTLLRTNVKIIYTEDKCKDSVIYTKDKCEYSVIYTEDKCEDSVIYTADRCEDSVVYTEDNCKFVRLWLTLKSKPLDCRWDPRDHLFNGYRCPVLKIKREAHR